MDRAKLKRIVEAIEAAEKAIKDLSSHKRDLYADNKDEFEPKVLRKIIARRKMDPDSRTRDDDLLDQYENALGMTGELAARAAAGESTYDEAAKAAGVSRRTMARHVKRAKVPKATANGTHGPERGDAHDPHTGELKETGDGQDDDVIELRPIHNHNARILERSQGVPAQLGALESGTDPRNPNVAPTASSKGPMAPQAAEAGALSVTPVPDGGVGAGTLSNERDLTNATEATAGDEVVQAVPSVPAGEGLPEVREPSNPGDGLQRLRPEGDGGVGGENARLEPSGDEARQGSSGHDPVDAGRSRVTAPPITDDQAQQAMLAGAERLQSLLREKGFAT